MKIFLRPTKNSFIRIRNEQVVGSSPIASSSEIKASGSARELFLCLVAPKCALFVPYRENSPHKAP